MRVGQGVSAQHMVVVDGCRRDAEQSEQLMSAHGMQLQSALLDGTLQAVIGAVRRRERQARRDGACRPHSAAASPAAG